MKKTLYLIIALQLSSATFSQSGDTAVIVDRFGQLVKADFKTKVNDVAELKKDVLLDQSYYNSLKPPQRDIYGGLLNSKKTLGLRQTGFFHTQKLKNGKWVLVTPLGNAYFSLGVNGVGYAGDTYTHIKGRENIYEWLPTFTTDNKHKDYIFRPAFLNGNNADNFSFYVANRLRKDKTFTIENFYNESVYRLQKWGFNSEGGFSNSPAASKLIFPQVCFANLPQDYRIPGSSLFDIFRPGAVHAIRSAFEKSNISERANDPLIIGYFFGNEIDYHQFKSIIPSKKASEVVTKKALVDFLQLRYKNIQQLNKAWAMQFAAFADMYETPVNLTTDAAVQDVYAFFEIYMNEFYNTVIGEFRRLDKNHLTLGDRYFTPVMQDEDLRKIICSAASRHLDVLSYNYYAYDPDVKMLVDMYKRFGKPVMLTEYHYGDPTQGQTSSIKMMDNEKQKGEAYRNYLEKVAATGFIVGAHWFEYLDQSVTGRWFQGYYGEGFGIGLLNVADRPYKIFLKEVMKTNYAIYDVMLGKKQPFVYTFDPDKLVRNKARTINIFRTASPMMIDGVLDSNWPNGETIRLGDNDIVSGLKQENSSVEISLAYDDNYLYLFGRIKDETPATNAFEAESVYNGDGLELFFGPENTDKGGALLVKDRQLIIGASKKGIPVYHFFNNVLHQPEMKTALKKNEDNKGYTLEAAIPFKELNIPDIYKSRQIRFDIGFNNGDERQRNTQYMWNGAENNSSSRDNWGVLIFN